MKLTANNVTDVFLDCLPKQGDTMLDCKFVDGILTSLMIHRGRVEAHKAEILELLHQLPKEFQNEFQEFEKVGASSLKACLNKDGEQWTDMHRVVEMLFILGLSAEFVELPIPRNEWDILPGGMPYYVVTA